MANWVYTIELVDLKEKYDDGELTNKEIGEKVAERIKQCNAYKDLNEKPILENFAKRFEKTKSENGFNKVLTSLYNWGDTALDSKWNGKKKCWIGFAL